MLTRRAVLAAILGGLLLIPSVGDARGRRKAAGVKRDHHGKIARSSKAKADFRKNHPCPSTGRTKGACPGYEVDHAQPLACGGADSPGNMQWLSKSQNRRKSAKCRW